MGYLKIADRQAHQIIELHNQRIEVVRKKIKRVHLSVHPPEGRVKISAPLCVSMSFLRDFAVSRLAWIQQQQEKIAGQVYEAPYQYIGGEHHFLWGNAYVLSVVDSGRACAVEVRDATLVMMVKPQMDTAKRKALMDAWYRDQLRSVFPALLAYWEPIIGVKANQVFIQQMKTRWGSCSARKRNIRLNTELAKKNRECLEYVLVHELVHLLEPSHNARFKALMSQFMPQWQHIRRKLNDVSVV